MGGNDQTLAGSDLRSYLGLPKWHNSGDGIL